MPQLMTYRDCRGKNHFLSWWEQIKGTHIEDNVRGRILRLSEGHLGDAHHLRFRNRRNQPKLTEVRVNVRPGFRIYLTELNNALLLLMGGNKDTQQSDIRLATKLLLESESHVGGRQSLTL